MSDDLDAKAKADAEAAAKAKADADAKAAHDKTYSDEEFKKVVAERDKAKDRLRKIEEDEKKAAESKAIEEGKLKEVLSQKDAELTEAKKQLEAYNKAQADKRTRLLEGIKDVKVKEFAEKTFTSPDTLEEFLGIAGQTKITPFNAKAPHTEAPEHEYKSFSEFEKAMKAQGKAF